MKRSNSIDLLRIVAAFFIVCIHTEFFAMQEVNAVARFAVPVFFMISGYFFIGGKRESQMRSIKKILILVVLTNILFFAYKFALAFLGHNAGQFVANSFSLSSLFNFLVFNESPFGGHLWFLSALLYCMIIAFFLSKIRLNKVFMIVAIAVLLIGDLIFGKYSLLIFGREFPVIWVRNFIFVGLPYFYLGSLFKGYTPDKIKVSSGLLITLIILFALTSVGEKYFLGAINASATREHYISTTFLAVSVFVLALKHPMYNCSGVGRALANAGRKYSLAIYIIHPVFRDVIGGVAGKIGGVTESLYYFVTPVAVFLCSLIFVMIYYKIKDTALGRLKGKRYKH